MEIHAVLLKIIKRKYARTIILLHTCRVTSLIISSPSLTPSIKNKLKEQHLYMNNALFAIMM